MSRRIFGSVNGVKVTPTPKPSLAVGTEPSQTGRNAFQSSIQELAWPSSIHLMHRGWGRWAMIETLLRDWRTATPRVWGLADRRSKPAPNPLRRRRPPSPCPRQRWGTVRRARGGGGVGFHPLLSQRSTRAAASIAMVLGFKKGGCGNRRCPQEKWLTLLHDHQPSKLFLKPAARGDSAWVIIDLLNYSISISRRFLPS
jgi:hypothetical protein